MTCNSVIEIPKTPSHQENWCEPQPLATRNPCGPYPIDALPETIRAAVDEVHNYVKAPLSLVAGAAMAATSVTVQCLIDIRRAEGLTGPVSLYILSVADSGERKTTVDKHFTTSIRTYEREQAEAMAPKLEEHKAAFDAWRAKRDGLLAAIRSAKQRGKDTQAFERDLYELQGEEPKPLRVPRLLLGDETPEALAWSLAKLWPSAGVLSSEAGLILGAHGMGPDSVMRNLALLNILWDGGIHHIDRRTSESFTVEGARMTMGLQIQEPTLAAFINRSGGLARGTGFLARFLIAWPKSTQGARPFTDAPAHWPHLAAFHRRITELLNTPAPLEADGTLRPVMLSMTSEARALWIAFHDEIEAGLGDGGKLYDVRDVAAKCADNAARLAAVFHAFESGTDTPVSREAVAGAVRIAAWHLREALRFFGELVLPGDLADAVKLEAWLMGHCRENRVSQVLKNNVRQYGPIRNGARLNAAILELEELDRLRVVQEGRRILLEVNPGLLSVVT